MKLYIGNLPWSIDDKKLKKLFESYGQVEEAVLIKDKFSGRSKGFGFVTLSNDADAQKAIEEMNQKEVEGRKLTVSEAKPMVPRDNNFNDRSGRSNGAPRANPSAINGSRRKKDAEESDEDAEESDEDFDESEED